MLTNQTLTYSVMTALTQEKGGLWAEFLDNETMHTVQVFKGGSISFNGKMIDNIEEIYQVIALELQDLERFGYMG
jgi:hypothetical protein